jgi:hypothetical protein
LKVQCFFRACARKKWPMRGSRGALALWLPPS